MAQLAAAEKEMDEHLAKLVGMQSVKDNMKQRLFAFLFTRYRVSTVNQSSL